VKRWILEAGDPPAAGSVVTILPMTPTATRRLDGRGIGRMTVRAARTMFLKIPRLDLGQFPISKLLHAKLPVTDGFPGEHHAHWGHLASCAWS
jgi:hypothetical protein